MLHVKLKVVGGELETREVALTLPAVVGRGREVTVHLPHPLVSRRHCEIRESDGRLWVCDLGSLNGTFVGSQRVQDAELGSGELLTVGTVTFRAVYESASDSSSSPLAAETPNTSNRRPQLLGLDAATSVDAETVHADPTQAATVQASELPG